MTSVGKVSARSFLILTVVLALLSSSFPFDRIEGMSEPEPTRLEAGGGLWGDDFSDLTNVADSDGLLYQNKLFEVDHDPVWEEGFESFTNGQNILGSNGWMYHGNGPVGTVEADTTLTGTPSKTVAVYDNTGNDINQGALGPEINIVKGRIRFFVMASHVFNDDHTSTRVVFYGTNDTYADNDDRMLHFGFNYNSISYYRNGYIPIYSNPSSNTWYEIVIDLDCTTNRFSASIYDINGAFLASLNNMNMENTHNSIKRLCVITGRQRLYPSEQQYKSYLDNVCIYNDTTGDEGSLTTSVINLEEGKYWSTLKVNASGTGEMKVDFVDQAGSPIIGFQYDGADRVFDIRQLNDLGVRGFALKVTMNSTLFETLRFHGWSYEWHHSNSYYDGFNTNLLINPAIENLEMENGWIYLEDGEDLGKFITERISVGTGCYWDEIILSRTEPSPSVLYVDVYDPSTGTSIKGFTHLRGNRIDISGLDAVRYPEIALNFRFERWGTISPRIDSISVTWTPNTETMINSMDIPDTIFRGEEYQMTLDLLDLEQPVHSLEVSVEAKRQGSDIWTDGLIRDISYNGTNNKMDVILSPSYTTTVGTYDLRCIAEDDQGNRFQKVFSDNVTIRNNRPSPPVIELQPDSAKSEDTLRAVMVRVGSDVETSSLTYNYRWYINNEHIPLHNSNRVQPFTDIILDPLETKKGDLISVQVFAFDGIDMSTAAVASLTIKNTAPYLAEQFSGEITIPEDPGDEIQINYSDICCDVDGDALSFSLSDPVFLSVETDDEFGFISIIPDENWFGEETVTMTISDGSGTIEADLMVEVYSVNDLPVGSILLPADETTIFEDQKITFSAEAEDLETDRDDLEFSWMMGDYVISTNPFFDHYFSTTGSFNVTCYVSDGDDEVAIGSILVTVEERPPEYIKEDFQREYTNNGLATLYDILDLKGNIENVREDPGSELDILSLTSELVGENIEVTMTLAGYPDMVSSSEGEPSRYFVYFITQAWSEPVFDSSLVTPDTMDTIIPAQGDYYRVGPYGSLGYLSYGTGYNEFGDPEVDGNSIIWTIQADWILNSEMDLAEFDLYGASLKQIETSEAITIGFDTIGQGSLAHQITGQPKTTNEEGSDSNNSILIGFLAGAVILMVIIIVLLVIFIFLKKGKDGVEEEKEGNEKDEPISKSPLDPNRPSGLEPPVQRPALAQAGTAPNQQPMLPAPAPKSDISQVAVQGGQNIPMAPMPRPDNSQVIGVQPQPSQPQPSQPQPMQQQIPQTPPAQQPFQDPNAGQPPAQ